MNKYLAAVDFFKEVARTLIEGGMECRKVDDMLRYQLEGIKAVAVYDGQLTGDEFKEIQLIYWRTVWNEELPE